VNHKFNLNFISTKLFFQWRKNRGRFDITAWSKQKKRKSEEVVCQNSVLKSLDTQVLGIKENINKLQADVSNSVIAYIIFP